MKKCIIAAAIITLLITGQSFAATIIDQQSPHTNTWFNADASTITWQQEVKVGITGSLVGIDLFTTTPGTIDFFVNSGSGWQTDANDFSISSLNLLTGTSYIDLSTAGLSFNSGDYFVIGIQGINDSTWLGGSSSPGLYADGSLFYNGSNYYNSNYDLGFNTYVNTVPEPTTMILFCTGILGLVGFNQLKRRK